MHQAKGMGPSVSSSVLKREDRKAIWAQVLRRAERALVSESFISPQSNRIYQLLQAAEDHRFAKHNGMDPVSCCRAIYMTFIRQKPQGGSTIPMQLARILSGRYERTLARKLMEIYLARRLMRVYRRETIMDLYLSLAYFGWGMEGLRRAQFRIGKSILEMDEVSPEEVPIRTNHNQGGEPRELYLGSA